MAFVNPNDPARQTVQSRQSGNPPAASAFDTVDETGVPWRNRAAEWRRKAERDEARLEAERAAREELESQLAEVGQPTQQGLQLGAGQPVYGSATQPTAWVNPATGQSLQQPGAGPVLDPTRAVEQIVDHVILRRQNEADYRAEMDLLGKTWPSYDDEDEQAHLCDFLRAKGYPDQEIERFGPRDVRFAYEAMRAEERANGRRRQVRPQELVLDTSDGVAEQGGSEEGGQYSEAQIAAMTPEQVDQMINDTMRAPRDYGED